MSALPQFLPVPYAHGELMIALVEALRSIPRSTAADLAAYLGLDPRPVHGALRRLEHDGAVVVRGRSHGSLCYAMAGEDPQRAERRADAAARELGAILALLDRAGAPTATHDGRTLAPSERVDMLLSRGWAYGKGGDKR